MHEKKTKFTKLRTLTLPVPYLHLNFASFANQADLQLLKSKLSNQNFVLAKRGTDKRQSCSYRNLVFRQKNHEVLDQRKKDYKLIRPLLNCSRYYITRMCEQLNLPVYPDKSNRTVQYSRNRIRKQILPSLKIFFNPQVEDAIFRFAEHIIKLRFSLLFDH